MLVSLSSIAQQTDGLIFNLRQNWVQYDVEAESFLPVISQASGNTVSFYLKGEKYESHLLYINNSSKAYMFNESLLMAELEKGGHYFKIDSLLEYTGSNNPLISIYGEDLKNNLVTYIVSKYFTSDIESTDEEHFRNKSYSSFFIFTSLLMLAGLIIIKLNSKDLFLQYSAVFRAFNVKTIDELIYKGRFFVNPGIQMIIWISFSASFVLYYLLIKLNIYFFNITWFDVGTIAYHSLYLLLLTASFLLFFLLRFLLISVMSIIFDMSATKNIHYATFLRLTFYLVLVLQFIITLDYFSLITFSKVLILSIIFTSLFLIIILIGIRLSFIIRHTFIQLLLYLCGTEFFLFVFAYKLVVG